MIIIDKKPEDKPINILDIVKTNCDLYIIGDDAMTSLKTGVVHRYREGITVSETVYQLVGEYDEHVLAIYNTNNIKIVLEGEE